VYLLPYHQGRNSIVQDTRDCEKVNSTLKLPHNSYSFLDIQPLSRGHALVIPKEHTVTLHELSDDSLADLLPVAKKVAKAIGVTNYNILQYNGL
jgi:diadenosine tetraphosphate (Ap4A) HIT family hydrolase